MLRLSLQWANPKAMAAHRVLVTRHTVGKAIKYTLVQPFAGRSDKNALQASEITVRVVGSEEGKALNQRYRGKSYATNVLTFDYALLPVLSADVVLCAPVLEREATEQRKSLLAHYVHMIVHGTLHAMGYDHERSQQDADQMEAREVLILQTLGFSSPYEP